LSSIGATFNLFLNEKLNDIDELSNLTYIGGGLRINGNTILSNVDGLSNVNYVPWFVRVFKMY